MYKSVARRTCNEWTVHDVDMSNFQPSILEVPHLKQNARRQLIGELHQALSNICLPRTHLTIKLEIVRKLRLQDNRRHVLQFLQTADMYMKKEEFRGPWHKDKFKEFIV